MKRTIIAVLGLLLVSGCARVTTDNTPPPPEAPAAQTATAPQAAPAPAARPAPVPKQTAATPEKKPAPEKIPAPAAPAARQESGLIISDLKVGSGPAAQSGQQLKVKYVGSLADGTIFDKSAEGEPFLFTLGGNQVIKGWDQGLAGMKTGGKRKLVIPPELAYGKTGVPPTIPPNAKLIFEIELLAIE